MFNGAGWMQPSVKSLCVHKTRGAYGDGSRTGRPARRQLNGAKRMKQGRRARAAATQTAVDAGSANLFSPVVPPPAGRPDHAGHPASPGPSICSETQGDSITGGSHRPGGERVSDAGLTHIAK